MYTIIYHLPPSTSISHVTHALHTTLPTLHPLSPLIGSLNTFVSTIPTPASQPSTVLTVLILPHLAPPAYSLIIGRPPTKGTGNSPETPATKVISFPTLIAAEDWVRLMMNAKAGSLWATRPGIMLTNGAAWSLDESSELVIRIAELKVMAKGGAASGEGRGFVLAFEVGDRDGGKETAEAIWSTLGFQGFKEFTGHGWEGRAKAWAEATGTR